MGGHAQLYICVVGHAQAPCHRHIWCHLLGVLSWSCRKKDCLDEHTTAAYRDQMFGTDEKQADVRLFKGIFSKYFTTVKLARWVEQRRNAFAYKNRHRTRDIIQSISERSTHLFTMRNACFITESFKTNNEEYDDINNK